MKILTQKMLSAQGLQPFSYGCGDAGGRLAL